MKLLWSVHFICFSSRFTDSKKYEEDCVGCFKLDDTRYGEICNACVLIVKRWKKLPANTTKDWHHVVDARTGPGIKNVFKNKTKKDTLAATPEKHVFKHKHVYRRKRKRAAPVKTETVNCYDKEQSNLLDFIDTSYWRRKTVCCGVVYIGQLGEVMFDRRYSRRCSLSPDQSCQLLSEQSEVSSNEKDQETHDPENEEFYPDTIEKSSQPVLNNNDNDSEDTFYDKLDQKMDSFTATPSLITSH